MNLFSGIGRVGRDPVVRNVDSDAVISFSVAVDSGFGDKKKPVWFDCSLWGNRAAKLAPHVKKGDRIAVSGEIGTREHEGKTYLTLRVSEVTLLGVKTDSAAPAKAA